MNNYEKISAAIDYLRQHFKEQPSLDELAAHVYMSPFHFQRLFTEWAGVSPKKFLQYLTVSYAKQALGQQQTTLFDTAQDAGLSGTGRLHDLFLNIEAMTPGQYKNGGEDLQIEYSFSPSPFGAILIATTERGICHLAFADDKDAALAAMRNRYPVAQYKESFNEMHQAVANIFTNDGDNLSKIKLHIKGTPFQLKVWEALLKIPTGKLTTYASLAETINHPKASRAVGSAVGDNPIAFLIPCHRVIRGTGIIGDYHWGTTRKMAIIGWEAATYNTDSDVT